MQPPFLKIPGFKLCYERLPSRRIIGGCRTTVTLGPPAIKSGESATVMANILETLKQDSDLAVPGGWEDVTVKTPTGSDLAWKKIHVTGNQFFDSNSGTAVRKNSRRCRARLTYGSRSPGLAGAGRLAESDAIAGTSKLVPLQTLTAGTVEIGPAPEAAPAQ